MIYVCYVQMKASYLLTYLHSMFSVISSAPVLHVYFCDFVDVPFDNYVFLTVFFFFVTLVIYHFKELNAMKSTDSGVFHLDVHVSRRI